MRLEYPMPKEVHFIQTTPFNNIIQTLREANDVYSLLYRCLLNRHFASFIKMSPPPPFRQILTNDHQLKMSIAFLKYFCK